MSIANRRITKRTGTPSTACTDRTKKQAGGPGQNFSPGIKSNMTDFAGNVRTVSNETTASSMTYCSLVDDLGDLVLDGDYGWQGSVELAWPQDSGDCTFPSDVMADDIPEMSNSQVFSSRTEAVGPQSPHWESLGAHECLVLETGDLPPRAARRDVHAHASSAKQGYSRVKDVHMGACGRCPGTSLPLAVTGPCGPPSTGPVGAAVWPPGLPALCPSTISSVATAADLTPSGVGFHRGRLSGGLYSVLQPREESDTNVVPMTSDNILTFT